jgi:hypothetical protein
MVLQKKKKKSASSGKSATSAKSVVQSDNAAAHFSKTAEDARSLNKTKNASDASASQEVIEKKPVAAADTIVRTKEAKRPAQRPAPTRPAALVAPRNSFVNNLTQQTTPFALSRKLATATVKNALNRRSRPSIPDLTKLGIIQNPNLSSSLHTAQQSLARSMSRDILKNFLEDETRPSLEDLESQQIYHSTTSPTSFYRTKSQEKKKKQEKLSTSLHKNKRRPSFADLEKAGIAKNPATHVVDRSLRRRSLEANLTNRPSFDEVTESFQSTSPATNYYNNTNNNSSYGNSSNKNSNTADDNYTRDDYDEDEENANEDLYYEKSVEEDFEDDYESDYVDDDDDDDDAAADDDDDYDDENDSEDNNVHSNNNSNTAPELDERMICAIALRAAAQLEKGGFIDHMQKANLKEAILDGQLAIVDAVYEFADNNDADRLMLVFQQFSL